MSTPASRRVQLGTGLSYHLLEWDADSDHTVVLVHGFLDIAWTWQPVVREGLAGKFHIVAPEMRGHGDSDRIGAGGYYHFMDYLVDLTELIGQVARGGKLSLIGHSMGGSVASYWAGTYPERVHRLALLEGTGPPEMPMPLPDRVRAWVASWKRVREKPPGDYADLAEAAAQLRKHDALLGETMALEMAEHGTVRTAGGRLRFKHDPLHATMGPYPFRVDLAEQFWKRITCPVLLVDGGESSFRHAPAEAERRAAAFAKVERRVLPGAAHMMTRHQPAALATMLAEFLGGG
jgi:pimeloyl-ACP methyl ester carboxylesterase